MDYEDARLLTEDIKVATEQVWALLQRAHDQGAWKALRYPTWSEYVYAEFGMGKSQSYRLLALAVVVEAFREVSPMGDASALGNEITERQARCIPSLLF